jgi:hypothetical protein
MRRLFRRSSSGQSFEADGRAFLENPSDPTLLDRWTRAVVDAIPDRLGAVADHLASIVEIAPQASIERIVVHELGLGREALARELLDRLRSSPPTNKQARLRHSVATKARQLSEAEEVAAEALSRSWISPLQAGHMAAQRFLAAERPELAREHLIAQADNSPYGRHLLLTALRQLGKHDEILVVLADGADASPVETMYRYDALLAVGDLAGAHDLAMTVDPQRLGLLPLFNLRHVDARRHGSTGINELVNDVRTLEASGGSMAGVLWAYSELGLLDEMERIEAETGAAAVDPMSRIHLARVHYLRHRFDRAIALLDQVRGFDDRWEAEMLRLRVLLEAGRPAEAIARHTPRGSTNHTQVDDALYHAFLSAHRLSEAFSIASPWRQRQTVALFGDHASDGKTLAHVGSRFVISQSGPGDEILAAGLYRELQDLSDELVITCDPRIEATLSRSFPGVTFLPVQRLRPRTVGAIADGRAPRAENAHFESLTADAMRVAEACDEVVLSRNIQHLAAKAHRQPSPAYLVPDASRVAAIAARWQDDRPRIGIVWRSELGGPMRDIHYFEVEQLAQFFDVDATFVSLQYDATDDERAALERMTGGRVHFPDDLDLRDDFEAGAALSANLSAVVGVCTTAFELAAATGVPGVLLAPNHMLSWRSMDARGQDFWHRSVRLALAEPVWARDALAKAGAAVLQEFLTGVTPGN